MTDGTFDIFCVAIGKTSIAVKMCRAFLHGVAKNLTKSNYPPRCGVDGEARVHRGG